MDEGIIIHLMEKEGIIRELSYVEKEESKLIESENQNSFLTELISSAEAVALVHDFTISRIQFKLFDYDFNSEKILTENINEIDSLNVQVVFDKQPEDNLLLNTSAIIWGSKKFDSKSNNILKIVTKFYTGLCLRKKSIQNFQYYRKKFEKNIIDYAFNYLDSSYEKFDSPHQNITETSNVYGCIGIYEFSGSVIHNYYCENGHISLNTSKKCSICGKENQKILFYRIENMSLASLASQLKASDSLKYIFQWIKFGERIIQSFRKQSILSGKINYSDMMLLPQKMFFKEKSSYGISIWHFDQCTLKVALLSESPFIITKETRKNLSDHQQIFEKNNWNYQKLKTFYGLNSIFDNHNLINNDGKLDTSILLDLDYNL